MIDLNALSVGDTLMMARTVHNYANEGDVVAIDHIDHGYNEVRVYRQDNRTRTFWVAAANLTYDVSDPSEITSLDAFKALVVKTALKFKADYNWCGTAEYLLHAHGLGDLLPQQRVIRVVHDVTVNVPPGVEPENYRRLARQAATGTRTEQGAFPEGVVNVYNTENAVQPATPYYVEEHHRADIPEGETLTQFKERLRVGALKGASDYSVSGVREFLQALAIDPDTPVTDGLTVTITIPTSVPAGQDPAEFARGLLALAGVEGVTVAGARGE